ncbi:uncharacterized protein LOC135078432 [Ostrinia nubilalis]|uniref:uncharacterized protein LOC135078432 n=1 Tax=Ostrinia nubilalis TaxID=29057 RepID=UPI0030823A9F
MHTCAACKNQFTDGVLCSVCKRHFDFACSGITEQGYRKLGDRRNGWRCPGCKNKDHSPKPSASVPSPTPALSLEGLHQDLKAILLKLAPLAGLADDVKGIKSEIINLQASLNMAHELISGFTQSIKALESRVKDVEESVLAIPKLQAEVVKINQELCERDQWSRASNVEIKGIPPSKNENLFEIALKIGSAIDCPLKKDDLNFITRVPSRKPNTPKPIIMCFNNRYLKEEFIAAARKLKTVKPGSLGFQNDGQIFVNDHLTVQNKNLLSKAKALGRESNFQFVWVKHCKIMARKSPTSPIITIKTERDLSKIK